MEAQRIAGEIAAVDAAVPAAGGARDEDPFDLGPTPAIPDLQSARESPAVKQALGTLAAAEQEVGAATLAATVLQDLLKLLGA